ncbi:unnamed protein product [Haemonchus placei]|uniref:Dirigent protein n=1 Tax=Haemonchus placei TaxID=6290 RepID=A0A0N4W9Z0_HAEPC|nr:unnamed protein product [Haemonchus placei]
MFFSRVIFNYIAFKSRKPWFVMEFSSMGFIAKLFRCSDLKYMTHAIALYYRFKPVDWILMDILQSRYCSLDESKKDCAKTIRCYQINSGTSQFQHVGKISSLTGKVQKIYDHTFGTGKWNPFADVISSMPTAEKYEAQVGYSRNVGIWFTNVTEGGFVSILFLQPINISGVMFLSGVPPAIDDKFGPETEVYALDTEGRRTILGRFSLSGDFLYRSDGTFVEELRIEVKAYAGLGQSCGGSGDLPSALLIVDSQSSFKDHEAIQGALIVGKEVKVLNIPPSATSQI